MREFRIKPEPIDVGACAIGPGQPIFIVAEVGINHNGDRVLAREAIAAAAEAGADAVKFQNYRTSDFVSDRTLLFEYWSRGERVKEAQWDLFKRCELDRDGLAELKEEAERHGIDFHSTPTSKEGVEDLARIGCGIVKNGSDYLTNLDLVRAMGESGLTTVLSTGMATLSEIDDAVCTFRETGNSNLIVLHCTSSYPTPPSEINLARIPVLQQAIGAPVGLSDHSEGTTASVGAVCVGACWIEKHFTLDRDLPGPDHWFSMDPAELRRLVDEVRAAEQMLGSAEIAPTESEVQARRDFRLSCVAATDLDAGDALREADIAYRRPGTGVPPVQGSLLIGRRLSRPVAAGHVFDVGDFE